MRHIFVFGSNLAGNHEGGAARFAHKKHGAVMGVGEGLTGDSYAIPTMDKNMERVPLSSLVDPINSFLDFAEYNHEMCFHLTPIGTGIAGHSKGDIAAILKKHGVPSNVVLTSTWITD